MRVERSAPARPTTIDGWQPPRPPDPPRLYEVGRLTGRERERAHEANLTLYRGYARAYAAYAEAHVKLAARAGSAAELRRLGPIAAPSRPVPAALTPDELVELGRAHGDATHALFVANEDLSDVIHRVEGRPLPLEGYFVASAELTARAGSAGVTATLSRDGFEVGPELTGAGPGVSLPGFELEPGEGGPPRAEVTVGLGWAATDGRSVEAGLCVGKEVDLGRLEVGAEVRVGAGVRLLDPETVRNALSRDGWWGER